VVAQLFDVNMLERSGVEPLDLDPRAEGHSGVLEAGARRRVRRELRVEVADHAD
jgi:hypothetical protein